MNCRHCAAPLEHVFLDLGFAPPSNAYLSEPDLHAPETHFPLKLRVCAHCWLVQTEDYARADELFRHDYAYFSSTSQTWLEHAARYARDEQGGSGWARTASSSKWLRTTATCCATSSAPAFLPGDRADAGHRAGRRACGGADAARVLRP